MKSLNLVLDYLAGVFTGPELKYFLALLGGIAGYVLPGAVHVPILGALGLFVLLDLVTGVLAAQATGEPLTSKGARRTLYKIAGYSSVVLVAATMLRVVGIRPTEVDPALSALLALMVSTEGLSVLENVYRMGVLAPPVKALIEKLLQRPPSGGNHE